MLARYRSLPSRWQADTGAEQHRPVYVRALMTGPLAAYVTAFVDGVGAQLSALSGREHQVECVVEADDLVSAIFDSDGRLTGAELEAWLDAVGTRLEPPVLISTEQLRESELINGKRRWVESPSTLFDLLLRADARDGGRRAIAYYDLALKLAHASAAIDLVPSPDEITAIDRFRTTMLSAIDAAGVSRPGRPATSRAVEAPPLAREQPELPPERPIEELLVELDALIGLEHVKTEVRRLTSLLRVQQLRAEQGLPVIETSRHLVFVGNPGTGKTTVARLLSQIYRSLDVVAKGHLVETERADLVAGFVGQTAAKTKAVLESALGGTVLIDEAYALARGGDNDFGREAIDTLVKFMEDHRDDLAVVVAGYPDEMREFIESNPGLESRFARTLEFPDYTTDELLRIFDSMSEGKEYHLDAGARDKLAAVIDAEPRGRGFGNARFVRNVFEQAVAMQAVRLTDVAAPTRAELTTLTANDIAPV
jgi:AAA lid domain/ATPase family associated with various cellular activities (AAA)